MKNFFKLLSILLLWFININILFAKNNLYLAADKINKNEKTKILSAKGKVQVQKGGIKIKSDILSYNLEKKEITFTGNVEILSDTGDIIFAEQAKLKESLSDGYIKNLGILLSDESRIAASSANAESKNNKTIYKNIVFTKCKKCADDGKIIWSLKAKKASHLKKSKVVVYEGVILETFEVPILYIPIFFHPDPTVNRKTGLLAPNVSSSNVFGYSYKQPIFFKLSKSSDLTVEPILTSKEGPIISTKYREKYASGEIKVNSSITKGSKARENEPTKKIIRGHLDFGYANKFKNGWRAGANIKRASDASYLSRYKFSSGESLLTQNIFIEKGSINNNIMAEAFKFQSLSTEYAEDRLPFIKPRIQHSWNNYLKYNRIRNIENLITFNSISKRNNEKVNSIHIQNKSDKKRILNGLVLTDILDLNLAFYNSNNLNSNYTDIFRFFSQVGILFAYPLIKKTSSSTLLLEPITEFYLGSNQNENKKIKNEDSKQVNLTSSNLFESNRYSGNDRIENGFRINYGLKFRTKNSNGSSFSSLLGRTYHNKKQELFDQISGFDGKESDFVGNLKYDTYKGKEFYYDFRFSDGLDPKRNRLLSRFKFDSFSFNLGYIQIRDFKSSRSSNTEQIDLKLSKDIFRNWNISLSQYRDLSSANFSIPLKSTVGVTFKNECTQLNINYVRDKSNDIDIPAASNLNFKIKIF